MRGIGDGHPLRSLWWHARSGSRHLIAAVCHRLRVDRHARLPPGFQPLRHTIPPLTAVACQKRNIEALPLPRRHLPARCGALHAIGFDEALTTGADFCTLSCSCPGALSPSLCPSELCSHERQVKPSPSRSASYSAGSVTLGGPAPWVAVPGAGWQLCRSFCIPGCWGTSTCPWRPGGRRRPCRRRSGTGQWAPPPPPAAPAPARSAARGGAAGPTAPPAPRAAPAATGPPAGAPPPACTAGHWKRCAPRRHEVEEPGITSSQLLRREVEHTR